MLKNLKFFVFFLLLLSVNIFSQDDNIKNYSFSEGLKSEAIFDITQDSTGYLWLATDKGLVQFDGLKFKNYTVHSTSKANTILFLKNQLITAHYSGLFSIKNDSISYLGNEKINNMGLIFLKNQGKSFK